jgi:hypothetical protein
LPRAPGKFAGAGAPTLTSFQIELYKIHVCAPFGGAGQFARVGLAAFIFGMKFAKPSARIWQRRSPMIRKLASGGYRLYSAKKNASTGKRRNLGTFSSRTAAEKHERAVQYFKRQG